MKKFILGLIVASLGLWAYQYFTENADDNNRLEESSALIEQQIKNVSKLVVSEGYYSRVYTYRSSRELLGSLITADKNALVVVNAEVSILYDLKQLQYEIDAENQTIHLTFIPEPEVKISPKFNYYDVTAGALNPFDAEDYNKIDRTVRKKLRKKVMESKLVSNAENRLVAELAQFYVLVNSLGWTLSYNDRVVESAGDLEVLTKAKK